MIVFIKENHRKKGVHRFLESFSIIGCEIVFVDKIGDTNLYEDKVGVFGGFLPQELTLNTSIKDKYYTFCSPFGQADLSSQHFVSSEMSILLDLKYFIDTKIIKNAITSSKSLSDRLGFIYIPPVKMNIDVYFVKDRKNYGFLGNNFRKHKNVVNQLAAISQLEPKETIIVNGASEYVHYSRLFDCKIESRDLKEDSEYYKEIASHRLCFQCSYSESFDYQALEYCFMGVPVICSPCVYWMPIKELIVKNVDDSESIREIAQKLLKNKAFYDGCSRQLKIWATRFNETNKEKLKEVLNVLGT